MQQAATGTQEVSRNITGVTEAAAQTGQAAGELRQASNQLSENAQQLRQEIEAFMARLGR